MFLTVFVIVQLVMDVAFVVLLAVSLFRRPAAPAPLAPPEWYGEFMRFAQDLVTNTEPVLEALEGQRSLPRDPGAVDRRSEVTVGGRHRNAAALLRAGLSPEEVARRGRLLPGELRLITNVVAAETASAARRRE